MPDKDELIQELFQLHQDTLKAHNGSIESLAKLTDKLTDAVVGCIETEVDLTARLILLERSVVYKELPDG
jgi:hypothetical protein